MKAEGKQKKEAERKWKAEERDSKKKEKLRRWGKRSVEEKLNSRSVV